MKLKKTASYKLYEKADTAVNQAVQKWRENPLINILIPDCRMEVSKEAVMAIEAPDVEKKLDMVVARCAPAEYVDINSTLLIIYNVHTSTIAGILDENPDWLVGFSIPKESLTRQ